MKINTDPMNMDALDFDGDMWDPEYCDSLIVSLAS